MIVCFTATKLSHEKEAWHLLIYDTIRRSFYNTLIDKWHEQASANLLSYYYIEKCKKIVFMLGSIKNNNRDFYDIEQNRTIHTVSAITILDLSKISNLNGKDEIEKCKEMIKFPFFIEKYLRDQGRGDVDYVRADCTVDVKKSMLYITAFVHYHENPIITIAKNLCDGNTKFHDFDLGVPILRTRDITKDKNKPIYTSRSAIKAANFPNYLHRYDWRGFYNFVNSKTINTSLIFIAYPDFLVVDRHYHRLAPFYKEFSDFYLADSLLIDDWLVGYYMLDGAQTQSVTLAGLFVINDLTIVGQL